MKYITTYISEKLRIHKNMDFTDSEYIFDIKCSNNKSYKFAVSLPFKFYIKELNEEVEIRKIVQTKNEWDDIVWAFYEVDSDKDKWRVITLLPNGIYNIFISNNKPNEYMPLVSYVNGKYYGKYMHVELLDAKTVTMLKESIDEKLQINKDIAKQNKIFWFTNNLGLSLPIEVSIYRNGKQGVSIISNIVKHNSKYDFYNSGDTLVFTLRDYHIKYFLIKHTIITQIYDKSINLENADSYVVRIENSESDKIIKESIDENLDNKTYVNMILCSPENDSVLILKRANYMKKYKTMWGFPGGSLDEKDKDSKAGAIRELKEETGIELSWNEEHKCKLYDKITNNDGSISEYWITTLETIPNIKISKEHSKYEWFNIKSKENHKWMPDVFQIIQKILD